MNAKFRWLEEYRDSIRQWELLSSKWERIFKDPMTTAAAIDRLVDHSTIIEVNVGSCRLEKAQAKQKAQADFESQTQPAVEPKSPQNQ